MTGCKVHNVRFYNVEPKAIYCMVFNSDSKKLAVSRSDATIQIWNLVHTPFIERTIISQPGCSIESLCWCKDRLFSVGLQGLLVEYDLYTLSQKYFTSLTGGAAWCMDLNRKNTQIAIGTEDGYLNLFSIESEFVMYEKFLDKQEGRILCVKYDVTGRFIVSGGADAIRIWNVETGHAIHRMTTGRSEKNKETLVWCITVADDFTIISGDSRGRVTIWDGETAAQVESYQSHKADVLSLVLSQDQKSVYCAGVDPIIMTFVRVNVKGENHKWVKSIQRKIHDHDVRVLTLVDDKLYSGGVDGYLALSFYPPRTLVKYPPIPQNSNIVLAPKARYILCKYYDYLEIWHLGKSSDERQKGVLSFDEHLKKLLTLQTKNSEPIVCCSISSDGKWIVYNTNTRFRLYQFDLNNGKPQLKAVTLLPEECKPSLQVLFTPDCLQLVLAPREGGLQIYKLSDGLPSLSQELSTADIVDTITFLMVSKCGTYLAAADPQSNIVVWCYSEKKWSKHCKLPRYHSAPTAIAIQSKPANLMVVYANHKIIEYNLKKCKFSDFSRDLDERHPKQWLNRLYPVTHVTFDQRVKHIAVLHDDSTICIIDKNKQLPKAESKIPKIDSSNLSSESMDGSAISSHAFHAIKKYKHLVYLDWLSQDELVAVEVKPNSLIEQLPPCMKQNVFGTK